MSEQAGRGRGRGPIKWALRQSWLWVALVLVLLAAATYLLRLQRLSVVPPGLFQDEGANGLDALQVLQGHHAVFFPTNHGREGLVVYGIAALIPLLGRTVLAVRLPTALASAGAVLACFWLGLVLFGDPDRRQGSAGWRRGFFIATAGAGLLAVSLGYNIIGRNAFRANYLPLLLAISMAALWSGFATRQAWRLVLAGVTTGLLAYTYIPTALCAVAAASDGSQLPLAQAGRWGAEPGPAAVAVATAVARLDPLHDGGSPGGSPDPDLLRGIPSTCSRAAVPSGFSIRR